MSSKEVLRRMLGEFETRHRVALCFVFLCIIVSTGANVANSFVVETLIDNYIPALLAQAVPDYGPLKELLALAACVFAAGVICTYAYNRTMAATGQSVQKKIRDNMFAHLQTLPIRYFDTHTHGSIMSHFTNDVDTLREFFSMSLPQIVSAVFTILMCAVSMFTLNKTLAIFVYVMTFLTFMLSKQMTGKASGYFRRQQAAIGDLNGYIKEMIAGQKVIKVFCHEQAAIAEFQKKNDTLRSYAHSANRIANIIMPTVMNMANFQYVAIAIVGGAFAMRGVGGVTLGSIAAFLTLSRTFSAPIGRISSQVNAVTSAMAGARRIYALMDEAPELDDGDVTLVNAELTDGELTEAPGHTGTWAWRLPDGNGGAEYVQLKGDVRLFDVHFSYTPDKPVLRGISLFAKPGQKIAFVGATGAGKTTITNLLNRFYDIDSGTITYDGIDVKRIKKADLRRSLGIVLQDTHLFTGTVADNIRYGRPGASDDAIREAARLANAHSFISRLPERYDTFLSGDGDNLSGGQRQLLAISRAAAADPPVMILDEATSSIDTRTEAIVQQGMDSLMHGRTVFVIAHRLSTVKNAAAIMVLENGEIIERGDHDDLIAQKGRYYQLYTGAFADS